MEQFENLEQFKVPTIAEYLEEVFPVSLTRREIFWLREQSLKRLQAAEQCMANINASPAKHSKGYQEFLFHRQLSDHLQGICLDEDELLAQRKQDAAKLAEMIESQYKAVNEQLTKLKTLAAV